jgi:crossover junction endodeoxyribonuclease RusA
MTTMSTTTTMGATTTTTTASTASTAATGAAAPQGFVVDLPLPPSVNHRYVRTRRGGVALTARAREYHESVYAEMLAQLGRIPRLPPDARLGMRVQLCYPDRRRRDLDNALKALLDAVCGALGVDDAAVDLLVVSRTVVSGAALARTTVWWR